MTTATDDIKFLSPADVVSRYANKLSIGTLANWRCQGVGPRFVKIGGKIFYPLPDLEKWESERTVQSTAEYRRA